MKSKRPFLHFDNLVGFMVKVNLITRDKSLTQHYPEVIQGARARRKGLWGVWEGEWWWLGGRGLLLGPPGARRHFFCFIHESPQLSETS